MNNRDGANQNTNNRTLTRKAKTRLFLFALLIHLIIVFVFIDLPIALDDMFQYDMLARSLASGRGYRWYNQADVERLRPYLEQLLPLEEMTFPEEGIRTAHRPPGYPFFLAALYLIHAGPQRFALVRVVQAVLSASLSLLVVGIGEIIGLSKKDCVLAGLFISLYPILLFFPLALASENVFIPLLTLAFYLAWRTKEKPESKGLLILLGFVLGFMVLTVAISVLVMAVIVVWLFVSRKGQRKLIWIPVIIALLLIMPWSVRNSILMGEPAFVENSLWFNMYIGYHPEGNGNFKSSIAVRPLFITDNAQREAYTRRNAIAFIQHDPLEALRRILIRIPAFLGPETRGFNFFYSNNLIGHIPQPWISMIYLLLTLPWFFVSLFGTIGIATSTNKAFSVLAGFASLFFFLPHLPILTEPRFHLPLVPLLIPFAVASFRMLTTKNAWKVGLTKQQKIILGLIVVFFVSVWAYQITTDLPLYLQLLGPDGNRIGLTY